MKKIYLLLSIILSFSSLSISQNTGNEILTYEIPGQVDAYIDTENDSIHLTMNEFITDITMRIASFTLSEGAVAHIGSSQQVSSLSENNFSNGPLIYTVTAEDGTQRDWVVFVNFYYNQFSSFSLEGQDSSKVIGNNVNIWMPYNADLSNLVADYTLTWFTGDVYIDETIQASGITVNNWSDLLMNYTVFSSLGSENECTVNIILNETIESMFYSFEIEGQESATYDYESNTIDILMPTGTNYLTQLVANFDLLEGLTVTVNDIEQIPGETTNDWSSGTVLYNIETEDETVAEWMVNVNVALHSGNEILEFYIPGQINSEFDLENNTIEIYMNEQIDDYSNLIAEFILSEGATAFVNEIEQFSEETANDFNSEFVIYNIIAEDGTSSEWKIFVPFICDWDPHSSINQINNSSLFKIFPNPNNGTLKLSIELDDIKTFNIEVLNVNGKLVKQIEVVNYQIENSIDLSELNSGLYYIKVNTAKETMVQKISIIK